MTNENFEFKVSERVKNIKKLSTLLGDKGESDNFMNYHKEYLIGQLLMVENFFKRDLRHIKKYGR